MSDIHKTNTAKLVYVFYLAGIIIPFAAVIGLIIAYVNKSDAPDWLQTHYQFQITTFWIGFIYLIVGGLLSMILIGYLILLFWLVWIIVRCVKGIKLLDQQQPSATQGVLSF